MKKFLTSLIVIATLLAGVMAPVALAAECGGVKTSIDWGCKSSDRGVNTVTSLLLTIIDFMAVGVGIAVVGGIVFGGIRYASANGNASQAQQGVTYIVNSVIGLLLFIFMYAIINFLVPGGLFT